MNKILKNLIMLQYFCCGINTDFKDICILSSFII